MRSRGLGGLSLKMLGAAVVASLPAVAWPQAGGERVDTALIVSVDVSSSVDEQRYRLQMEGIAKALEDPAVIDAILNGPNGGILFSLVTWADKPHVAVPWAKITNRAQAIAIAGQVRRLPQNGGDFTCLTGMLRHIADKIVPQVPMAATRVIVDVSGDGSDNCNPAEPIESVKNELAQSGVTINGLPILEGREAATLEGWYKANVVAGPGAFVLPANGFEDFGRAMRQKFVIEISGLRDGRTSVAARGQSNHR